MMVRNFLRICHIACRIVLVCTLLVYCTLLAAIVARAENLPSGTMAIGTASTVSGFIDKFMANYTRDLAKRLGEGSRVEYASASLSASADTRACATAPGISVRDQTQSLGRVTLFVACGKEWSIYVPIDLNVFRPVVVANKPLPNNAIIAADDVVLTPIDVSQLNGVYLTSLDDAIGMGVKRSIAQGAPLISQQLESPMLIRRGDAVVISAESGILAVKMEGTAMTDGRRGEQIRIKNRTSSRIVDARVVAPGQVLVPM